MDELELEIALDRLITEMVEGLAGSLNARQTKIDTFISIQSMTLDETEIAGLLTSTGAIRVEIDAMIRDAVRLYAQSIVTAAQSGRADVQKREGAEKQWTWQTESDKPCPDCKARSGLTYSYAYWESVGLPQQGTTICGSNCKCVLVST